MVTQAVPQLSNIEGMGGWRACWNVGIGLIGRRRGRSRILQWRPLAMLLEGLGKPALLARCVDGSSLLALRPICMLGGGMIK